MPFLIAIAAIMLWAGEAKAGCTCQCVDGRMQPLCSSTLDIAPPCMGICPLTMPGIAPLDDLSLPPLGTTSCRQAQVCDQFGNCRWQRVCR
jgi:hypothetical protein